MNRGVTAKKNSGRPKNKRSVGFNPIIGVKPYWKNMTGTRKHVQPPRKSRKFWGVNLPPRRPNDAETSAEIAYWTAKAHEFGGTLENMQSFVESHVEIPQGLKDPIMNRLANRLYSLEKQTMEAENANAAAERAAAGVTNTTQNTPEYGLAVPAPLRPANNTNLAELTKRHEARKVKLGVELAAEEMLQRTMNDALKAGYPAGIKYITHPLAGIGFFTQQMQFIPVGLYETMILPSHAGEPPIVALRVLPPPPSLAPNAAAGFRHMVHSHNGYVLVDSNGNYTKVELMPVVQPANKAPVLVPIGEPIGYGAGAGAGVAPSVVSAVPLAVGAALPSLATNTFGNDPFANLPTNTLPNNGWQNKSVFNNL